MMNERSVNVDKKRLTSNNGTGKADNHHADAVEEGAQDARYGRPVSTMPVCGVQERENHDGHREGCK
jgi:hypothetical protein